MINYSFELYTSVLSPLSTSMLTSEEELAHTGGSSCPDTASSGAPFCPAEQPPRYGRPSFSTGELPKVSPCHCSHPLSSREYCAFLHVSQPLVKVFLFRAFLLLLGRRQEGDKLQLECLLLAKGFTSVVACDPPQRPIRLVSFSVLYK